MPKHYFFFLINLMSVFCAWSQGLRQDFDVVYKLPNPELKVLVGEHYEVYYTGANENFAQEVLSIANDNTTQIEYLLGYRLSGKISIRAYFTPVEFESYIGNNVGNLFSNQNTGGITEIIQNDFKVVYKGNQAELKSQVIGGICHALVTEMLYGGTVQEKIKYASLLQLPHWFIQGLVAYVASPWNAEDDNELRDIILSNEKLQISDLTLEKQRLIGKNIWKYMAMIKGEVSFQRILYLVRLTRKIENATYFVFNWNTQDLIREWQQFALGIYARDQKRKLPQREELMNEKYGMIVQVFSTKASYYLVTQNAFYQLLLKYNALDKSYVVIDKTTLAKPNRVLPSYFTHENKIFKLNRPNNTYQIEWLNGNNWTVTKANIHLPYIHEMSYDAHSSCFFLIAQQREQNVILKLDETGHLEELYASKNYIKNLFVSKSGSQILFAELLTDADSVQASFDIMEINRESNNLIARNITQSNFVNETHPAYYYQDHITFLSDLNGIKNSYVKHSEDSTYKPLTDYRSNISALYYNFNKHEVVEALLAHGTYHWYISNIDSTAFGDITKTAINTYFKEKALLSISNKKVQSHTPKDTLLDHFDVGIYFQTDFPEEVDFVSNPTDSLDSPIFRDGFRPFIVQKPSYIKPSILVTQLDNGFMNTYYQPTFAQINEVLLIPVGLNIALKVKEVADKYELLLGTRLARNFNQYNHYLRVNSLKSARPYQLDIFRQTRRNFRPNNEYNKNISTQVAVKLLAYQTNFFNVHLGWTNRFDEDISLSSDEVFIKKKNIQRNFTGPNVDLIFKKVQVFHPNLYQGLKAKAYTQALVNTTEKGALLYAGFDVRSGVKLAKNVYWMNRLQYEMSRGKYRVTYLLGGMENWLYPKLENSDVLVHYPGYYRMAASMRGFLFNLRNGNSFGLLNSEIRYKPLGSLIKYNARSEVINNLILIGFTDIGASWYGNSPYHIKSPINTTTLNTGSMQILVYNRKQPILAGVGYGISSSIFGYAIKYHNAWGYNNGTWGKSIHYLTLGLDF